jgi:hypothetical protein
MSDQPTILCPLCGESWDPETPGYHAAAAMLNASGGTKCPSCEWLTETPAK